MGMISLIESVGRTSKPVIFAQVDELIYRYWILTAFITGGVYIHSRSSVML